MIHLELNSEEHKALRDALDRCLNDLEREILHTDHAEFKAMLKQRKALLTQIVQRLTELVPA